jgi:hypothetical protein
MIDKIPIFPNKMPNQNSDSLEWSDFIEYIVLFKGQCAISDYLRPSFKGSDELNALGIENDEDQLYLLVDEIAKEIRRRIKESGDSYPFELVDEDYVLKFLDGSSSSFVYKFLLYTTYLNMKINRIHSGIDGAKLFEELSSIVAKNYLGEDTFGGVFGTALAGGFKDKLQNVMNEMGEGVAVKNVSGAKPQDEDIDIIVWKPFKDNRKSKLICFGQCKTGLSWESDYVRLPAKTIIDIWFNEPPIVDPVLLFFCSKYFSLHRWDYTARKLGIVFDRFRILSLFSELDVNKNQFLFDRIKDWVESVEKWLFNLNPTAS